MTRLRIPNGNTVVVPPETSKAFLALLLHRNNVVRGFHFEYAGEQLQFTYRGGLPLLVPFTPYPAPIL